MTKVHLFPTISTVHADTKLAGQTPGSSAAPAAFQVTLSTILTWMQNNLTQPTTAVQSVAPNGTISVPAGVLVDWIVIVSNGSARTVNIGTTAAGTDVADTEAIGATEDLRLQRGLHSGSSPVVLHFSGFTGLLNVKIYTRQ